MEEKIEKLEAVIEDFHMMMEMEREEAEGVSNHEAPDDEEEGY